MNDDVIKGHSNKFYHEIVETLVQSIQPFDELEVCHQKDALNWIYSGVPLCRSVKPDTPPKHLVSYFTLVDPEVKKLLLVDHKKALLWLPPGGHVEPGEHPNDTAHRELHEELGVKLSLLNPEPLFLTVTETVGTTAGHIDVSLWYVFLADSSHKYSYDQTEFNEIKWFSFDELPFEKTDPHLNRFCAKLSQLLPDKRD
ncbi:MAG: NUDIX domain-containing protein [Chlamydiota bacterium]